jgi:predicted nucleic acid-binding protein
MVLVDSSVWIEALRQKGRLDVKVALEALLEEYEVLWCSPVRLEVLGGARKEERTRLGKHFAVIPYRSCNEDDWNRAVALAWRLREKGITVPWLDVIIASIALHEGLRVYAIDAHFEKMAESMGLLLYQPGYGGSYAPG